MRTRLGSIEWAGLVLSAWACTASLAAAQTTITRVDTDNLGTQTTGGDSTQPSVSADGRYVAFASTATNLVPGDTNNLSDIFVKDRQTGAIERVSVKSDGTQATSGGSFNPSISADGRYVVFETTAALAADDTQPCGASTPTCTDIYVHDRTTHDTTRASLASDNTPGNGDSTNGHISADGRYVVFASSASNLVPGDTNNTQDIFLRDRVLSTTVRLSVSTSGTQADDSSSFPSMSDDGTVVAFVSRAKTLDTSVDSVPCVPSLTQCDRVYLVSNATVTSRTVSRVAMTPSASATALTPPGSASVRVARPVVSRDGRSILSEVLTVALVNGNSPSTTADFVMVSGSVQHHLYSVAGIGALDDLFQSYGISGNGREMAACRKVSAPLLMVDTTTGLSSTSPDPPQIGPAPSADCDSVSLSSDGMLVFFSSRLSLVSGDNNNAADVFVVDRDPDHDGMPSHWETTFGLDPNNAADASADPDGDGKTNLQEYQAGTNPKGTFTRYLAEGAMNSFFNTLIEVFNPNAVPTTVVVRYLGESGGTTVNTFTLPAKGYTGITPGSTYFPRDLTDPSFSTVVESDQLVAVERTMTWAGSQPEGVAYGSHVETAVTSPSNTWYFAEGATHGAFDLFYLLQNPNDTDASVTVTYLLPAGQAPIVITYPVTAHSRRTIWVDQEPGLSATDVSAKLESTLPIFAERALYLSTPTQVFAGGTDGAGLPAPANKWFVAEGATGGFFDLFYLIGNPSTQDASVTISYLLPDGSTFDKIYPVAAQSRLTISVDGEDPRLNGTSVSAVVTSTNSVPIVVERAMWWPSPNWYEGSLTAATTDTGTAWALAGGFTAPDDGHGFNAATYLLVANPGATDAHVTFSLQQTVAPTGPCNATVTVPAHGRYTTEVRDLCGIHMGLPSATFVGTITSDGPGIVVERATYWSTQDQFWSAGGSTLLTKIQ